MKKRFRILLALTYNDPLFQDGVMDYASHANWELDLSCVYYNQIPIHWKGDGIITHYLSGQIPLLKWVRNQRIPIVSLNADEVPYWPGTVPHHPLCANAAAEHFASLGITNLAYFRCSNQNSVAMRQATFCEIIEKKGGAVHLLDWRELSRKRNPVLHLGKRIKELPKPLGIFCQSDHRASILYNACETMDIHVPTDVAILAVGNNEKLCNLSRVPLSSVDIDLSRVAREGAALLHRILLGEPVPEKPIRIPPIGVVQRQSTRIIHVSHAKVAEAIRFIQSHSSEQINANSVIRQVGMSRSGLSRLFEKHIGQSISDVILRIRMEQVKHRLLATTNSVQELSEEAGFSSYIHFAKAFIRYEGCTATEYRQNNRRLPD